ncbi:MAG TPA: hypothetical protein VKO66_08710 [Sideroxyarcus sp.]|nr:hypothetical protein [Sideroxyarcus sp.]
MTKTSLLLLLTSFIGTAAASERLAPGHGFLVFSASGVANYAQEPNGGLRLQGKLSSGSIDDFVAADGRIYRMDRLLGKVSELGADLKPIREGTVKSKTGIPYWLGMWDEGLLVLNDNAVVYLDDALKEVALLPLEPRRHDQITPVLNPVDFDVWEKHGYLLANTGEVFIIPLGKPESAEPLLPTLSSEEGLAPEGQWIDPAGQTLNFLVRAETEEHDAKLKPGEWRVIRQQVVLTRSLKDPGASALRNVVHEERQIHEPMHFDDGERPGGMIIDRRPPYRAERPATGTYIGILSRTTPAYAEAFERKTGQLLSQFEIVRLGSGGRYEVQALSRKVRGGPLWFKVGGQRWYIESDLEEHVLRLQPEPYGQLQSLPELHEVYFKALAY